MQSLYVGNLASTTTEEELLQAFSRHGTVTKVSIVTDRETGASRGFAFVEMADNKAAAVAIKELNLVEMGGRSITVNEARPQAARPHRGGGGRSRR